jgi:hypothetical protein
MSNDCKKTSDKFTWNESKIVLAENQARGVKASQKYQ